MNMDVIRSEKGRATISLSEQEAITLVNAINEAREAVEDWEFQTRVGVEPEEADALRKALKALLVAMRAG